MTMDKRNALVVPFELAEFRSDHTDDLITIRGYAAVYFKKKDPGTEFSFDPTMRERIAPGAFDRAIAEDDVIATFNHNPDLLLARTSSGTLSLKSDRKGLRYTIRAGDTSTARDVREHIRRQDLAGSSFTFRVTDQELSEQKDGSLIRTITEVELYEVGPVATPAYAATSTQLACRDRRKRMESELRKLDIQRKLIGFDCVN